MIQMLHLVMWIQEKFWKVNPKGKKGSPMIFPCFRHQHLVTVFQHQLLRQMQHQQPVFQLGWWTHGCWFGEVMTLRMRWILEWLIVLIIASIGIIKMFGMSLHPKRLVWRRGQEGYHTNQHPSPHEGTTGQPETRPLQRSRRLPHQPTPIPTCRETTGVKTTSQPKKATKPNNTHAHMKGEPETTGDKTTSEAKKATSPTNNHHHMKGDNGRQPETRPLQRPRRLPHQPTRRETVGDKTTSEAKKATRYHVNQHPSPHEGRTGDNGRQDHFRGQEGYLTNQHPSPHEGRQRETTGDKTIEEAKKATTPTNTQGDNWRQDDFRGQEGYQVPRQPTPIPTWRETTGDNGETRPLHRPRRLPRQPTPIPTWRETTGDNGRQDHLQLSRLVWAACCSHRNDSGNLANPNKALVDSVVLVLDWHDKTQPSKKQQPPQKPTHNQTQKNLTLYKYTKFSIVYALYSSWTSLHPARFTRFH